MRDGDIRALCQFFAAFEWSTTSRTPWINERSDMWEYTSRGLVEGCESFIDNNTKDTHLQGCARGMVYGL